MNDAGPVPAPEAALARVAAVDPAAYASTRNHLQGAVTGLSPYLTHGLLNTRDVLDGVAARHALHPQHKLVFELGWREYFRHVWAHRGEGILESLHAGPLPDAAYARELPADIRRAATGVPVVDQAVRTLHATGGLHNHARLWLASYVVHLRKVHWRAGADWMIGHLLDGDLASNHLGWQWVAGTGSHKPYLFNADNVAKYAPPPWHSPGSVVDAPYETLDQVAQDASAVLQGDARHAEPVDDPPLLAGPPGWLGLGPPDPAPVAGREVWLVHPWSLGELPQGLPAGTVVVGVCVDDFHRRWPWSERRWRFVGTRLAALAPLRWHGSAEAIGAALSAARRVRGMDDPHLAPWLQRWAQCDPVPAIFPTLARRCDSFSQWWSRAAKASRPAPPGPPVTRLSDG